MSLGTVPEGVAQPDSLGASIYVLLHSKGAGLPYSMLSSHWLGAPLSLYMYIASKGSHQGRILGEGCWKPKLIRADGGGQSMDFWSHTNLNSSLDSTMGFNLFEL